MTLAVRRAQKHKHMEWHYTNSRHLFTCIFFVFRNPSQTNEKSVICILITFDFYFDRNWHTSTCVLCKHSLRPRLTHYIYICTHLHWIFRDSGLISIRMRKFSTDFTAMTTQLTSGVKNSCVKQWKSMWMRNKSVVALVDGTFNRLVFEKKTVNEPNVLHFSPTIMKMMMMTLLYAT